MRLFVARQYALLNEAFAASDVDVHITIKLASVCDFKETPDMDANLDAVRDVLAPPLMASARVDLVQLIVAPGDYGGDAGIAFNRRPESVVTLVSKFKL